MIDLRGFAALRKPWGQPGVSAGWASCEDLPSSLQLLPMKSASPINSNYAMTAQNAPSRRKFLVSATGAAAAAGFSATLTGCQQAPLNDRQLVFASLNEALRELDRLQLKAQALKPATAWTWAQTLAHCAQSIEYSLQGFPQPKPAIFQQTLGSAAFKVFSWRGRMSHDLGEPIPGAPPLPAGADPATAALRLQRVIQEFQATSKPLHGHFAYGELSKPAYEQAHAMHLANHFSAFDTVR
jgi:hypothetical protein